MCRFAITAFFRRRAHAKRSWMTQDTFTKLERDVFNHITSEIGGERGTALSSQLASARVVAREGDELPEMRGYMALIAAEGSRLRRRDRHALCAVNGSCGEVRFAASLETDDGLVTGLWVYTHEYLPRTESALVAQDLRITELAVEWPVDVRSSSVRQAVADGLLRDVVPAAGESVRAKFKEVLDVLPPDAEELYGSINGAAFGDDGLLLGIEDVFEEQLHDGTPVYIYATCGGLGLLGCKANGRRSQPLYFENLKDQGMPVGDTILDSIRWAIRD